MLILLNKKDDGESHPLNDLVGPVNSSPSVDTSATSLNNSATPEASASRASRNSTSASRNSNQSGTTRVNEVGVRPKPNEAPLPPGWDFSYSDKGRMFFIDHVNKQTSWIDPRTGKPSPTPNLDFESRIGPLPVIELILFDHFL